MEPRTFRRVAVYCGSSNDVHPQFFEIASEVGRLLAGRGIGIVYGAGNVGLMGRLADAALEAGGDVIGVIPEKLRAMEVAHQGLTELIVVDSMHARKTIMAGLSDAFVALPGGWGTLEEIFEAVTWSQLGYHEKPCGLLNAAGYYDALIRFVDDAVEQGFIRPQYRDLLIHRDRPGELLEALAAVPLPHLPRRMDEV